MKRTILAALAVALLPVSTFAATCPPVIQNSDGSYSITFPDGSLGTLDPVAQKLTLQMSGEAGEQEVSSLDQIGSDGRLNNVAGFRYTPDASSQSLLVKDKIDMFLADDGTLGGSYTPQDSSNAGFAFQIKPQNPGNVICLEDEAAPYLVNNPPDKFIMTSDSLVVDAFATLSSAGADLVQCVSDKDSAASAASSAASVAQSQISSLQSSLTTLTSQIKSNSAQARALRKVFRGLSDTVRRHSPSLFNLIRTQERYLDGNLRALGKQ